MSKKVNKRKGKNKGKKYDRKRARKMLNKSAKSQLRFQKLKGSADKEDVKVLNKLLKKSRKMKELETVREDCNHHEKSKDQTMGVMEFKNEYPERVHLVPLLEEAIHAFGVENIGVCPICLTPVFDDRQLTQEDLERSVCYTYLVTNTLKGKVKLKKKIDMPLIYKMQTSLLDSFIFVRRKLAKVLPKIETESTGFNSSSEFVADTVKASAASRRAQVSSED